jgi:hypothetical protein
VLRALEQQQGCELFRIVRQGMAVVVTHVCNNVGTAEHIRRNFAIASVFSRKSSV